MKKLFLGSSVLLATLVMAATNVSADTLEKHEVKTGDTLSEIASKYKAEVGQIASKNKIENIDLIFVGQELIIDKDAENILPEVKQLPRTTPVENTYVEEAYVEPTYQETYQEPVAQETYVGDSNSAKEWIAMKESSGSYTAQNGQYYGRYQLNPSLYVGYDTTPAGQEAAADAYVAGRYGTWEAAKQFWIANGWY